MTPDIITAIGTAAIALFTAIAAISAAFAAAYSARTIKIMQQQHEESISNAKVVQEQTLEIRKETSKADIFLECLNQYLNIMTRQARAIQDNQVAYAYDAQRALIDLLWFEFHLWQRGHIHDNDFSAWLDARRRSYGEDRPDLRFNQSAQPGHLMDYVTRNTESDKVVVSYKRVWNYLLSVNYYPDGDQFLRFMSRIHSREDARIEECLNSYKQTH